MSASVYTLNDGATGTEIERLDWQHRSVLTPITERLIPQDIHQYLITLGRPPSIADVATGTGIWLRDLATELPPDARLDGYDFDTSKFPGVEKMAPNITLAQGDGLKPFPAETHDLYDLVHVRCLVYGLKADQWKTMAQNLHSIIRPGEYLLWDEVGYPSFMCLPMTEAFQKFISLDVRYAVSVGRDITSPMSLRNHLSSSGFSNCQQTTSSSFTKSPELQRLAGEVIVSGVGQSINGIVAKGGFDWAQSESEVRDITKHLRADAEEGKCVMGFEIYWTIGQKE
ncbi:hypothetical protein FZEAL_8308 [Fusarium zealandicum]|uniref:Methyltransferase domain-containing protein n=1 Tax=Fusarium zealandicum TaxID=1053134 RepID=A0A8H4XI00_9HYPO|nr:hypothetical protein FZEAL_8308 [Fusarium zealandicum]